MRTGHPHLNQREVPVVSSCGGHISKWSVRLSQHGSRHPEPPTCRSRRSMMQVSASADGATGGKNDRHAASQEARRELEEIRQKQRRAQNPFPKRMAGDGVSGKGLRNQVQLSAYGHHIGTGLKDLETFLALPELKDAISGLHLLPVYPSSGDGGFAPLTYQEVDPEMGTWEDVERLSKKYDLQLEFMVNHISPASKEFQDFLKHGDKSKWADLWVKWEQVWGKKDPTSEQLAKIRTRKPEAPVREVTLADGSKQRLWCTFGEQQIDIDPFSESGRQFVIDSLRALGTHGSKLVRLDAFGYATKKPGTKCFFEEPEVWKLLEFTTEAAADHDTGILCEVHEDFEINLRLANRGYWVYDFSLPLLILHAFNFNTAINLVHWLRICPRRQITVLDTHDGMGIDDIAGLAEVADVEQLQETVENALGCNPNFKYYYKPQLDMYQGAPHQYNCTYFSAVKRNARHYLLARAIQFFTPGIPMIYYVGLLAGVNDFDAVEEQGPRGINRHRYSLDEARAKLDQPVVQALLRMCRFRNTHEAFAGDIEVFDKDEPHKLEVTWTNGPHRASLFADMKALDFHIVATMGKEADQLRIYKWELDAENHADPNPSVEWQSEELCSLP